MIIADTNILIDYLRHTLIEDIHMLSDKGVVTCGVVKAELLQGARNDAEVARIRTLLNDLGYIDIQYQDWEGIGFFLRTLRENGLSVPLADAIISYLAIKQGAQVWTRDKHFELIQKVQSALCLFCIEKDRQ